MKIKSHFQVSNIKYDTDGRRVKPALPKTMEIELDDLEATDDVSDALGDVISNRTGYCVLSFDIKNVGYSDEELNAIGDIIAERLRMKPDNDFNKTIKDESGRQRWKTNFGNKTGFGLVQMIQRFAKEIENGTFSQ